MHLIAASGLDRSPAIRHDLAAILATPTPPRQPLAGVDSARDAKASSGPTPQPLPSTTALDPTPPAAADASIQEPGGCPQCFLLETHAHKRTHTSLCPTQMHTSFFYLSTHDAHKRTRKKEAHTHNHTQIHTHIGPRVVPQPSSTPMIQVELLQRLVREEGRMEGETALEEGSKEDAAIRCVLRLD